MNKIHTQPCAYNQQALSLDNPCLSQTLTRLTSQSLAAGQMVQGDSIGFWKTYP